MKKKLMIFFIFLMVSFFSIAGNLNFIFSSDMIVHGDEDYKSLYGTLSYGWNIGLGFEPFLGSEFGVKFGQSFDTGFLSFTKENLTLNKSIITGFLNIYPLTLFMNDFFFYVEPFIVVETDIIMYKEESSIGEFSGNKTLFSFGGGVTVNLNKKLKLLFSAKYRNLNTVSPSFERDINTEGVIVEAGIRVAIFNL